MARLLRDSQDKRDERSLFLELGLKVETSWLQRALSLWLASDKTKLGRARKEREREGANSPSDP